MQDNSNTLVVLPSGTPDRFWSKVAKTGFCWVWIGACWGFGYGVFYRGPKEKPRTTTAHRVAWELIRGPIPEGLCVLHRCDNPRCVNPEHLFLGTKRDNTQDCIRKGRFRPGRFIGEAHWNAKLDTTSVRAIRQRYAAGGITHAILAKEWGVAEVTIQAITQGRIWRHLLT